MFKTIFSKVRHLASLPRSSQRNISISPFSLVENKSDKVSPQDANAESSKEPAEAPKLILVDKDGPITLIGINRPDHRNAINSLAAAQLCDAINNYEQDDTSSVGVLYGVGGSFCSGYEIDELRSGENVNTDILMQAEGSVGPTRRHLKKPMVCAIDGYCVANGLELALMCDLRVMEENAILGFFNRRIGVPVIDGGTARLPAMIGLSRALDLILTGRQVTADEALQYGLVNRCVATGTALGQAVNLACSISKFPQHALNHDRRCVYSSVYDSPSFDTAVQNEVLLTSKEVLEEIKDGIIKYNAGAFRGGRTCNTKEKSMADWENIEIEHEKEVEQERTKKEEADSKKK